MIQRMKGVVAEGQLVMGMGFLLKNSSTVNVEIRDSISIQSRFQKANSPA